MLCLGIVCACSMANCKSNQFLTFSNKHEKYRLAIKTANHDQHTHTIHTMKRARIISELMRKIITNSSTHPTQRKHFSAEARNSFNRMQSRECNGMELRANGEKECKSNKITHFYTGKTRKMIK